MENIDFKWKFKKLRILRVLKVILFASIIANFIGVAVCFLFPLSVCHYCKIYNFIVLIQLKFLLQLIRYEPD